MRIIPTRIHGMLDYASGLLLLLAPYIFNFADGTAAQYVPQAIGAGVLLMSLVTDYELSLAKLVPMPAHLAVDVAGGVLLAASPWLFGFADRVYWPHLVLGLAEIGAGLMTRTIPDTRSGAELRV
jgi:SPW repeat